MTSKGESICQEFCHEVLTRAEEIKCRLRTEHFTPLMERMVEAGYCCTQVKKVRPEKDCIASFERAKEDIGYEF
jgi:hypothetical protein